MNHLILRSDEPTARQNFKDLTPSEVQHDRPDWWTSPSFIIHKWLIKAKFMDPPQPKKKAIGWTDQQQALGKWCKIERLMRRWLHVAVLSLKRPLEHQPSSSNHSTLHRALYGVSCTWMEWYQIPQISKSNTRTAVWKLTNISTRGFEFEILTPMCSHRRRESKEPNVPCPNIWFSLQSAYESC